MLRQLGSKNEAPPLLQDFGARSIGRFAAFGKTRSNISESSAKRAARRCDALDMHFSIA
jgi:hypothetical protein